MDAGTHGAARVVNVVSPVAGDFAAGDRDPAGVAALHERCAELTGG